MKKIFKMLSLCLDRSDRKIWFGLLLLGGVITIIGAYESMLLKHIIDSIDDGINSTLTWVGVYIVYAVVYQALQYVNNVKSGVFLGNVTNKIREKCSAKVLSLDPGKFYMMNSGSLQDIIISNSPNIAGIVRVVSRMITAAISVISAAVIIIQIDPRVSLMFVLFVIVMVFAIKSQYTKSEVAETENQAIRHKMMARVSNFIKGYRVVRAFNKEEKEIEALADLNSQYTETYREVKIRHNNIDMVANMSMFVMNILVIGYSILAELDISSIFTLTLYVEYMFNPIITICDNLESFQVAEVAYNKVCELLEIENDLKDGKLNLSGFSSSIKFKDVSFSYDSTTNVLSKINFTVKKGQRIGICGPSGGGKSTILSLLNRFYDPSDGRIEIDDVNMKDLTINSLRRHIGIVQQDPYLFEGTILENILYGKPDAMEYEVVEAAKKANIHEFVSKLEKGYNTQVGDNGIKLSGGQKQRIAIARVFLCDPDIVLFDEATSALDNTSEQIIQESIDMLSKDKTTITVAHRLSTIKDSDIIFVVDDHKIVESGSYDDLIAKGGLFSTLARK